MTGVGGMVSFRAKLVHGMASRGVEAIDRLRDWPYESVLVIGGTRQLPSLWRARQRGVRIVQRLDGINWIHRLIRTGWRHFFRAEYGNYMLSLIRSRIAHHIVYQSEFVRLWWDRRYGRIDTPSEVIYNGVNLDQFKPMPETNRPADMLRVLLVEGSLLGGYEFGLEMALKLVVEIAGGKNLAHSLSNVRAIELEVIGKVDLRTWNRWDGWLREQKTQLPVCLNWRGVLPHKRIPEALNAAHLLFSSDLNAACPNSVVEAIACGTPVIAFDTGALKELVADNAGMILPYGGDPWKLDPPDIPALAQAAKKVLNEQDNFRTRARSRAEEAFDVNQMVTHYLDILSPRSDPHPHSLREGQGDGVKRVT